MKTLDEFVTEAWAWSVNKQPLTTNIAHDSGMHTHAEMSGEYATIVAHTPNAEGWNDTHGEMRFRKGLGGRWIEDDGYAHSPEAHEAMTAHARQCGINCHIPQFSAKQELPMRILYQHGEPMHLESFMGGMDVTPHIPADFERRPEHEYHSKDGDQETYRFKGHDGETRHLMVSIIKSTDKHSGRYNHGISFGVLGGDPNDNDPGDKDPDEVARHLYNHGRGQDVLSAVMSIAHRHIKADKPDTVSWMATSPARARMYSSMINRMKPPGYTMDRSPIKNDAFGGLTKFPKF